jgi:hypothetical protein
MAQEAIEAAMTKPTKTAFFKATIAQIANTHYHYAFVVFMM